MPWAIRTAGPVRWIDGREADAYCQWLQARLLKLPVDAAPPFAGALLDGRLRAALPSEPEWERAARGTDGRTYPWGEAPSLERAHTHMVFGVTSVVGSYPRGVSPAGCEDLSGNVFEWTRSVAGEYPYPTSVSERADREAAGSEARLRVLRGGAFCNNLFECRAAVRLCNIPWYRYDVVGFRVVWSPCL